MRAIFDDDAAKLRYLCESGVDIDERFGDWASALFTNVWQQRCCYKKIMLPFFSLNHPAVELRPSAIHCAMFFNSHRCLAVMMEMGVKKNTRVWLGPVEIVEGIVRPSAAAILAGDTPPVVNEHDAEKKGHQGEQGGQSSDSHSRRRHREEIFALNELLHICLQTSVHRITTGMAQRADSNWKVACADIEAHLQALLRADWLHVNVHNNTPKMIPTHPEDKNSGPAEGGMVSAEAESKSSTMVGDGEDLQPKADVKQLSDEKDAKDNIDDNNTVRAVVEGEGGGGGLDGRAFLDVAPDGTVGNGNGNGNGTEVEDGSTAKNVKKGRPMSSLLAPPQQRRAWREHLMVSKLMGPPSLRASTNGARAKVPVLGKKSFFLESRSFVVRAQIAQREAEYERAHSSSGSRGARRSDDGDEKEAEEVLEPDGAAAAVAAMAITTAKRVARKGMYDFVSQKAPPPSVPSLGVRKAAFLEMVDDWNEERFINDD